MFDVSEWRVCSERHRCSAAARTAVLAAAAKAKSEAKTRDAEQAIRALVKRGEPITFQAVQREAGISHAFLYNHPDLRSHIEHLRKYCSSRVGVSRSRS